MEFIIHLTAAKEKGICRFLQILSYILLFHYAKEAKEVNNRLTGWAFAHLVN